MYFGAAGTTGMLLVDLDTFRLSPRAAGVAAGHREVISGARRGERGFYSWKAPSRGVR